MIFFSSSVVEVMEVVVLQELRVEEVARVEVVEVVTHVQMARVVGLEIYKVVLGI